MLVTAVGKKRAVGIVLFLIILGLFLAFNRIPKLDAVGVDLAIVESPNVQCFQGFCIERDPGTSFLSRWWTFSLTYFRLVAMGMAFAFVVAGDSPNRSSSPPRAASAFSLEACSGGR